MTDSVNHPATAQLPVLLNYSWGNSLARFEWSDGSQTVLPMTLGDGTAQLQAIQRNGGLKPKGW